MDGSAIPVCVGDEFWEHFDFMSSVVYALLKEAANAEGPKKMLGGWSYRFV